MTSTEGREAIIWIREHAAQERGKAHTWLRKNVDQHRRDLGLPTRNQERTVAIRASVRKFTEAVDRLGKRIEVIQGPPKQNPYSAGTHDIGRRLKP